MDNKSLTVLFQLIIRLESLSYFSLYTTVLAKFSVTEKRGRQNLEKLLQEVLGKQYRHAKDGNLQKPLLNRMLVSFNHNYHEHSHEKNP